MKKISAEDTSLEAFIKSYYGQVSFLQRWMILRYLTLRDIKIAVALALFVLGWSLVYGLGTYKPNYASNSLIMVKDSAITGRYVDTDQRYSVQTTSSFASNPVLNTMGLLKSSALKDALWGYLKEQHPSELKKIRVNNYREWEKFYGNGTQIVKAKNIPGTDLISVQFLWSQPQITQEGLGVILSAFQEASLNLNKMEQRRRSQYLDEQVDKMTRQLAQIRRQKSNYKSRIKTVSLEQERNELTRTKIELETQLNHILAQAAGKQSETKRYQQMLKLSPSDALMASAIGQNTTMTKLQDQRYDLLEKEAFLSATLTDNNPKLKELRSQLKQVETDIQNELGRTLGRTVAKNNMPHVADPNRGSLVLQMSTAQAEASNLRSVANGLQRHLEQINQQLVKLPEIEEKLAYIDQQERAFSNALDVLHQKQLEAHLKEAETLSNVFIIDRPTLPLAPVFPAKKHVLMLGFLLGIAAGGAWLFARYRLVHREYLQPAQIDEFEEAVFHDKSFAEKNGGSAWDSVR